MSTVSKWVVFIWILLGFSIANIFDEEIYSKQGRSLVGRIISVAAMTVAFPLFIGDEIGYYLVEKRNERKSSNHDSSS